MLASVALATAASAATVIDTFTGTIVPTDSLGDVTTNDINNYFGGGSLLGQTFTLVFTLANGAGSSFTSSDPGGYPTYGSPNLMTASLTINGQTFNFASGGTYPLASDGSTTNGGTTRMQDFYWSQAGGGTQPQGVIVQFTPNIPTPADFNSPLPPMLAAQLTWLAATFYDNAGETLVLGGTAVAGVPEPSTLAMVCLGFAGLMIAQRTLRRKPQVAHDPRHARARARLHAA
jgi:hypothetical protein